MDVVNIKTGEESRVEVGEGEFKNIKSKNIKIYKIW